MPKINIPMSVRIAIISSVLLVIGVGGFFIHNIHQKNKYNDIIEVVDRSTNQKEKSRCCIRQLIYYQRNQKHTKNC